MKIQHSSLPDLTSRGSTRLQPWLEVAHVRLQRLPDHPASRILVAEEGGETRAVLGLRLYWGPNGRLDRAVICVLAVDPEHDRRGVGSRLVRFAEGITRIHGCSRVDVVPELEGWGEGHCWLGLGYDDPGAGLRKVLRPSGRCRCA